MKRRMVIILIAIIMILVLFLPSKTRDYDGDTTHYTALLYQGVIKNEDFYRIYRNHQKRNRYSNRQCRT